jgi:predicted mannosyl-3-phosphoglycerate phosphatase (HAD superfamily)
MERKFFDPCVTTVRVERTLYDLAKELKIELTYATKKGLEECIERTIDEFEKNKQVTPEIVEKYRDHMNRYLMQINGLITEQEALEMTSGNLKEKAAAIKKKQEEENSLIYVMDLEEEKFKWIKKKEFHPILHQHAKPPKPVVPDEEDK